MSTHEHFRMELGSYLAGALDPAERVQLQEHLGTCATCRDELASFAGIPGLLSRLALDEVLDDSLLPPPSLLPRLLDTVEQARRVDRSRLRRWRLATGALAAAVVAVVGVGVVPGQVTQDQPAQVLLAAGGSPATGDVVLEPRSWGTSVELDLQGLPRADSYVAFAHDSDGGRTLVASWGPTASGDAAVTGATALTPDSVRRLTVETDDGRALLALTSPEPRPGPDPGSTIRSDPG